MAADGQVVFEIQGDNKGLKNTLQDTTSAIQSESKKWDESASGSAKGMEASFGGALKGIAAAFAASKIGAMLVDFGKQAVNAASDLQEVQNVVDVTFGESANEINAWAKNAISQFGLTETQAKRFASTMGAMMKSSGIASKDITEMSENLAGLAADMASFYNLDFDEAFNKIRSGISGETEPLKQLGINMSVANLEAFALAQGIDKAFDKMSQSEQIMIRYQYLMQATADAQGDFARTSDGFANGLRLLESNFEQLKTTVGTLLLPIISQAISGLNDMMSLLIPATKPTTVLDDFANIDLQTEQKLESIRQTKAKADELVKILEDIQSANVVSKASDIGKVAEGANVLNNDAGTNWSAFVSGLNGVGSMINATKGGTQAGTDLGNLADGGAKLTGTPVKDFKYENLPTKIQELMSKAAGADTVKSNLGTIDQEAGELTKNAQTGFKYTQLISDLGSLETEADTASKDIPTDLGTLDDKTKDVTTDKKTGFKFTFLKKDLGELTTETGKASKDIPEDLKTLDTGTKDVTTDKKTGFKFTGLKKDLEGLTTETDTASTDIPENLSTLDAGTKDITKDQQTGFKFSGVKKDLGELNADVKTTADELPGNVETVTEAADKMTGSAEAFKYSEIPGGLSELDSAVNTSETNGTATKLADVADAAMTMTTLQYNSNGAISALAGDIKILDSTDKNNWTSILNVFNNIPGYTKKIDKKKIEDIANAFAGLGGDKAQAWQTLMDALSSDMTALQALTGKDENGAAAWLTEMKEAANGLNNEDVNAWNALLSLLVNDTPGAGNYLNFEDIVKAAQELGLMDTMMVRVGDQTMSVADANRMYQQSMKELVQLYPELNDLIDAETGEVKGGTTALYERIDAITKEHEKEVLLYGLKQKRLALEKKFAELPSMRVDVALAQNAVKALQDDYDKALERLKELGAYLSESGNWELKSWSPEAQEEMIELVDGVISEYEELAEAANQATKAYEDQQSAYDEASKQYDKLEKDLGGVKDAQEDGTAAAREYNDAQKKAATDGVKALTDALKEMNDYVERTKKSTADSVDSALKGFKQFETGEKYFDRLKKEQAAKEAAELKKQVDEANKNGKVNINVKLTGTESTIPTLQNMTQSLRDQLDFINEYQKNLEIAKQKGVSDELLAEFADFSQENAGYLYLIAHGSQKEVDDLNSAYKRMSEAKKPLIDSLTETKLKADESFNELVEKAKEAAIKLNNGDVAKDSMASTVEGIAQGIADKVPEVKEAVDALNAELERLGKVSNYNVFGGLGGTGINLKFGVDGSFAKGADYIPFDNYLAYLHEGEAVLTAEEAAIWRNFKNGGANVANSIDYGRLSGAIWDNAPQMGGNVYLDGRTVGRVISAQQANAYRSLERSGWQG